MGVGEGGEQGMVVLKFHHFKLHRNIILMIFFRLRAKILHRISYILHIFALCKLSRFVLRAE